MVYASKICVINITQYRLCIISYGRFPLLHSPNREASNFGATEDVVLVRCLITKESKQKNRVGRNGLTENCLLGK